MYKQSKPFLFILLTILIVMVGCDAVQVRGPGKYKPYEEFTLNTTDGVLIAASYYPSDSTKGIILLHMLAQSRMSYNDIAVKLMPYYKVMAIDLRGHGQSDLEYLELTDYDFKDMMYDVEAAAQFLIQEGVRQEDISLAGASVGANLALLYAAKHPTDKLVLLSPGGRLRGLDISNLAYSKPMLVQVGHYDAYSSISVDSLQLNWERARVMFYDSSAHGTDLLVYDLSAREDFLFYLT